MPVAHQPVVDSTVTTGPARYDADAIAAVFDRRAVVVAVRRSFIDHDAGRFDQAAPVHLRFPRGDCHIKSGSLRDGDTFVIKIATGFHGNDRLGLPCADGMMIVLSQRTGMPVAIFEDRGMMTAWRTAAATIVAAMAGGIAGPLRVGIVGTGLQAELAARWLPDFCMIERLAIWGRDGGKAHALATRIGGGAVAAGDLETLCRTSNLIVTATPASRPLIRDGWVRPGTHVVALGADNPGKCEIDPALFARCATIMTDDHAQCLDHGDFGEAVRRGIVGADADVPLGRVLSGWAMAREHAAAITVADLTGLAVQDDAIARLFMDLLGTPGGP